MASLSDTITSPPTTTIATTLGTKVELAGLLISLVRFSCSYLARYRPYLSVNQLMETKPPVTLSAAYRYATWLLDRGQYDEAFSLLHHVLDPIKTGGSIYGYNADFIPMRLRAMCLMAELYRYVCHARDHA